MAGSRLALTMAGVALLAGCQSMQPAPQDVSGSGQDTPPPRMHIFIESGNTQAGDITYVTKEVSLRKAIHRALPDATILPDPGVAMNQTISVWVEDASIEQYLDQVGRAADVTLEHSDDVVTVSQVARWNFILPSQYLDEAKALAASQPSATVTVLESSDDFVTLLVSARPSVMVQLRTAIFQLSDQANLDSAFGDNDSADKGE